LHFEAKIADAFSHAECLGNKRADERV